MKIEHIQKKNKLPYPMLTKRLDLVEKIERKSNKIKKKTRNSQNKKKCFLKTKANF